MVPRSDNWRNFHPLHTAVVCGEGASVKLTDAERKMCVKAAKAMGLTVAGVDFMRSSRGALVLEAVSYTHLRAHEPY